MRFDEISMKKYCLNYIYIGILFVLVSCCHGNIKGSSLHVVHENDITDKNKDNHDEGYICSITVSREAIFVKDKLSLPLDDSGRVNQKYKHDKNTRSLLINPLMISLKEERQYLNLGPNKRYKININISDNFTIALLNEILYTSIQALYTQDKNANNGCVNIDVGLVRKGHQVMSFLSPSLCTSMSSSANEDFVVVAFRKEGIYLYIGDKQAAPIEGCALDGPTICRKPADLGETKIQMNLYNWFVKYKLSHPTIHRLDISFQPDATVLDLHSAISIANRLRKGGDEQGLFHSEQAFLESSYVYRPGSEDTDSILFSDIRFTPYFAP